MNDTSTELKKMRKAQRREIWRRLRKNKLAMVGLVIVAIFVLVAIFADVIADYDTKAIGMSREILKDPSPQHLCGTDALGRDIFARLVHGSRVSLSIGIIITIFAFAVGGILGALAAYTGGFLDNIVMRICDTLMCIPTILMALAIVAALGTNMTNLVIAITISSVPGYIRFIRSVILTVVGQDYIEAARSCGLSKMQIITSHVLPNAIGPIIVNMSMSVAGMILSAAGLSYIGMGIQPPRPEWGAMLSEASVNMRKHPYLVIFPGLCILLAALSLNLFGDGLRDALDPRLKD